MTFLYHKGNCHITKANSEKFCNRPASLHSLSHNRIHPFTTPVTHWPSIWKCERGNFDILSRFHLIKAEEGKMPRRLKKTWRRLRQNIKAFLKIPMKFIQASLTIKNASMTGESEGCRSPATLLTLLPPPESLDTKCHISYGFAPLPRRLTPCPCDWHCCLGKQPEIASAIDRKSR